MDEKQINGELLRLAIITLLIASMFGILQYFPEGKTFDTLGMGATLKVIASTMLYFPFPIFILYLLLLGLNLRYDKEGNFLKAKAIVYDLGIILTTFIITLSALFVMFINALIKVPQFPVEIVIILLWVVILISAIITANEIGNHFKRR